MPSNADSELAEISDSDFRYLLGSWATGVAIVTSLGDEGPSGCTINALTSLSLKPPLVLVCFAHTSKTLKAVRQSGRIGINILKAEQHDLAHKFARADLTHADKFRTVKHEIVAGVPLLDGVLARLIGVVEDEMPGGDHVIMLVRPLLGTRAQRSQPLLFFGSQYVPAVEAGARDRVNRSMVALREELLKPSTIPGSGWREEVEAAMAALRDGDSVVVIDTGCDPWDGDLARAAEHVTAENLDAAHGLTYLSLTADRVDELGLKPMNPDAQSGDWKDAFTVSIEARDPESSGLSTTDLVRTVQLAIDARSGPEDLSSPGHVFPLRTHPFGVLGRMGTSEASMDIVRLAGLNPAAVVSTIPDDHGSLIRGPELFEYARRRHLQVVTVEDVVRYRWAEEELLSISVDISLPTTIGPVMAVAFHEPPKQGTHLALVKGEVTAGSVDVAVHHQCLVGDVFRSSECDCFGALERSLAKLGDSDRGLTIYVSDPGGSANPATWPSTNASLAASRSHQSDPVRVARCWAISAQILRTLGVTGPVNIVEGGNGLRSWLRAGGITVS